MHMKKSSISLAVLTEQKTREYNATTSENGQSKRGSAREGYILGL